MASWDRFRAKATKYRNGIQQGDSARCTSIYSSRFGVSQTNNNLLAKFQKHRKVSPLYCTFKGLVSPIRFYVNYTSPVTEKLLRKRAHKQSEMRKFQCYRRVVHSRWRFRSCIADLEISGQVISVRTHRWYKSLRLRVAISQCHITCLARQAVYRFARYRAIRLKLSRRRVIARFTTRSIFSHVN